MTSEFDLRYGEIIQHKVSGFKLEDVANELSIKLENIVKAIILEYSNVNPIVCIIRSVDRLQTKNIKILTGKKFSFMKDDNLSKLGVSPGAIPPFIGFQHHFKTFIDEKLSLDDNYYGSGGSVYNACKFSVPNYIQLGGEIKNLTTSA